MFKFPRFIWENPVLKILWETKPKHCAVSINKWMKSLLGVFPDGHLTPIGALDKSTAVKFYRKNVQFLKFLFLNFLIIYFYFFTFFNIFKFYLSYNFFCLKIFFQYKKQKKKIIKFHQFLIIEWIKFIFFLTFIWLSKLINFD